VCRVAVNLAGCLCLAYIGGSVYSPTDDERRHLVSFESLFSPWLLWFLLGLGLALLELVMPGLILIFFAIGCLVTTATLLLWEPDLTWQIVIFLISSLASLVLLRRWMTRVFRGVSTGSSNHDFDDAPFGSRASVTQAIGSSERGRIRYRGTDWYATADQPIESGAVVEIVDYADQSRQVFYVKPVTQTHEG
jgi:membrane protein implicated in regulation of membrane protease activity